MIRPSSFGLPTLLGRYAYRAKARRLAWAALGVIGVDAGTKAVAATTLREGDHRALLDGAIEIGLTFNPTALGREQAALAGELGLDHVHGMVVGHALLFAAALPLASAELPAWRKVLFFLAICTAAYFAGPWVGDWVGGYPGADEFRVARVVALVACGLFILRLARTVWSFTLLSLMVTASLSNGINLLVDPRGATDFVYVPALEAWFGIANLADYVLGIAKMLFVAWGVVAWAGRPLAARFPETRLSRVHAGLVAPLEPDTSAPPQRTSALAT